MRSAESTCRVQERVERADVVIVGGGVIGSAIAFNLISLDSQLSVVVVERDPSYRTASSALSASSIRQQFSTPVNIAMSRFSMAFFKKIWVHLAVEDTVPEIGLIERGYLYLANATGEEILSSNHALQRRCGVAVELLDPAQLGLRFPWLSTTDLSLGSLGSSGEGWFDGYSVLQAFRRKARALGVVYLTGEVVQLKLDRLGVNAVVLKSGARIRCGKVVNAAGPQARAVAQMAKVELPVYPEKHCIFVFDCKDPPPSCPLVIDPSGLYFRPEGRYFIAGPPKPEDELAGEVNLDVDHRLFEKVVWPALAARVPAFETIKLINAWAGHYEMNSFDHNALLGTAPGVSNLYFANGFSGHGMQQSPAVGLALAELILFGKYRTLDLGALSYDRLLRREPIREINII
jgi:FAD-dependent oxidoreductase domain-containing protein 1